MKIYGHRGCRGLLPENTIESFKKAIELGVDGIEWDVVVNKDNELIISHEHYIDTSYCSRINNKNIQNNLSDKLNIYKMSTDEIKAFDCGSTYQEEFPNQKLSIQTKPTVKEALYILKKYNPEILFEIKSSEENYGSYQPYPKKYAEIIADELINYDHIENIIFMSFDSKILNSLNQLMPDQKYIYLNYNPLKDIKSCLSDLNFQPFAIGLFYPLISKEIIEIAHGKKIKIYAWTVNDIKIGEELKLKGLDGIISDYPNLFIN